jgi:ATP-binding cassette subfamily C protein LapB
MLSILDRLIVIDGGRILADGPRDDVLKHLTQSGNPPKGDAA